MSTDENKLEIHKSKLVLVVEKNPKLQKFYALNLKVWVGANVFFANSLENALEMLAGNVFDLIISRLTIDEKETSKFIYNELEKKDSNTKFINIGLKKLNDEVTNLPSSLSIRPLIKASAKLLNVTAEDMVKLALPEYFGIDIDYFAYMPRTNTDVYKKEGNNFELVITADQNYPLELLEKLKEKNPKLYVEKNERLKLVNLLNQEVVGKIPVEELNDDESLKANEMTQNLLSDKLKKIGITKETVELSKKSIKNMVHASKRFPKLKGLVKKLLRNRSGYLYKHSQILMYVCSYIIDNIDWGNEDQKTKINFVCFFHDICLETDEQAQIYTNAELKASKLDENEKSLVNKHAQIAAELIHKYPHAPMGADVIIRQHHGIAHGIGFAENFTANLSPMTIVFILAENFVHSLITEEEGFIVENKIKDMRERFHTQRFQKIIDLIEELVV